MRRTFFTGTRCWSSGGRGRDNGVSSFGPGRWKLVFFFSFLFFYKRKKGRKPIFFSFWLNFFFTAPRSTASSVSPVRSLCLSLVQISMSELGARMIECLRFAWPVEPKRPNQGGSPGTWTGPLVPVDPRRHRLTQRTEYIEPRQREGLGGRE